MTTGLAQAVVLPTNPEWSFVRGQNGTIMYIRAVQGHSHGVAINPHLFSLKTIPLNWKEHAFHTGSSSNNKSVFEKWSMGRMTSPISTRQACFFATLNPQESSPRQRTIDWKCKYSQLHTNAFLDFHTTTRLRPTRKGLALCGQITLDRATPPWVPARTPTVHGGLYGGRPWVARQQAMTRDDSTRPKDDETKVTVIRLGNKQERTR